MLDTDILHIAKHGNGTEEALLPQKRVLAKKIVQRQKHRKHNISRFQLVSRYCRISAITLLRRQPAALLTKVSRILDNAPSSILTTLGAARPALRSTTPTWKGTLSIRMLNDFDNTLRLLRDFRKRARFGMPYSIHLPVDIKRVINWGNVRAG